MDKQRNAERDRPDTLDDDAIDTSDIPEVTDWSQAVVGKFYRPVKTQVTLRIDADILEWFRSQGPGYQTAINHALRAHMGRSLRSLRIRTGEPCPESGIWAVVGNTSQTIPVSKGQPMPPDGKKAVVWHLLQRAA